MSPIHDYFFYFFSPFIECKLHEGGNKVYVVHCCIHCIGIAQAHSRCSISALSEKMNILFTYCSSLYTLQKAEAIYRHTSTKALIQGIGQGPYYVVWRGLFLLSLFIMLALRVGGVGIFVIHEQADYEPTTGNGSMGWSGSLYLIPHEVEIQCLQSNKLS